MLDHVLMIPQTAEKLDMLSEKKDSFTETFAFETYHRSEKLELIKEIEYDFRNQHHKIIYKQPLPC